MTASPAATAAQTPAAQTTAAAQTVAAQILDALVARGQTLAVAESLTGGLLAATLVDVPGASRAFRGGVIAYATDLKASLVGVADDLLRAVGPVDPQVALALARGARTRCGADWGLATTGVAGPDPQDDIPVGTVYVAIAGPMPEPGPAGPAPESGPAGPAPGGGPAGPVPEVGPVVEAVQRLDLTGSRAAIRAGAVAAALDLLAIALRQPAVPDSG
jgi:nicotinamide-nucleotide amidase